MGIFPTFGRRLEALRVCRSMEYGYWSYIQGRSISFTILYILCFFKDVLYGPCDYLIGLHTVTIHKSDEVKN